MQDFYDAIKHLAGGQVYAVVAPQDAQYPTLVYTPVDSASVVSLDGPKSPQWLSDQTHSEDPWKQARNGLADGDRGEHEITLASMAEYYSSIQ